MHTAIRTAAPLQVVMALLLSAATACTMGAAPGCAATERRLVQDLLYFGTAKPTGVVTPAEWTDFLGDVVTPRFPQGLTVWQASGQWRGADGAIVREPSFVLSLIHPADEASEAAIRAIIGEYKARFRQEAVLRVRSQACVSL